MRTIKDLFLLIALSLLTPFWAWAEPLSNGDSESGLDGWEFSGAVSLHEYDAGNHAVLLEESAAGALSWIYQEFYLHNPPRYFSIRYKLIHSQSAGSPTTVAPDSFRAYLLDAAGQRLGLAPEDEPVFSKGFLYEEPGDESSYVWIWPKGSSGDSLPNLLSPEFPTFQYGFLSFCSLSIRFAYFVHVTTAANAASWDCASSADTT